MSFLIQSMQTTSFLTQPSSIFHRICVVFSAVDDQEILGLEYIHDLCSAMLVWSLLLLLLLLFSSLLVLFYDISAFLRIG